MSQKKQFSWHWELSVCLLLALVGFGVFWTEKVTLNHVLRQMNEEVQISVRHAWVELGDSLKEETVPKVKLVFEHLLDFDRNLTILELVDQDQRVILTSRQRGAQGEVSFQLPFFDHLQIRAGISDLPLRRIKEVYQPVLVLDLVVLGAFMFVRRIQGGLHVRSWFVTKGTSGHEISSQEHETYSYSWNKMERERAFVAELLHEKIGQSLSAALMRLGMIPQRHSPMELHDMNQEPDEYLEVQRILQESITDITGLTEHLRPSVLDALGLWPALQSYVRGFESYTGIWVEYSAQGAHNVRFPTEIEILIFRIAQEGLENIHRHAQAGLVELSFCVCEHDLAIQVKDDGVGFNPEILTRLDRTQGGLRELRNRLHYYLGRLDITSIQGQGSILLAHIPLSCAVKRRDDNETDSCIIGG